MITLKFSITERQAFSSLASHFTPSNFTLK